MTMETMSAGTLDRDARDDELMGQSFGPEFQPESNNQRRDTVVIFGVGENTRHFGGAIERLEEDHPVHFVEVREPEPPVSPDRLHLVNTPEGRERLEQLLGSGAVHAVYGSLVPKLHIDFLETQLRNVGRGLIDFVVIAKPAVRDLKEMHAVDVAKREAEEQLRLLHGDDFDPDENPILYVHEHYIEKGAWHTLREQLGEVTNRLGRLCSVVVDIEEARTVEQEGRTAAFEGGALEDLGPHIISLGLNIQASVNTTDRYNIPNRSETSVERFRYEGSDLPDGVETGFIVRGNTQIVDNKEGEAYDLPFVWRGGKGLVDSKKVVLEFEHPDTGECTTVIADLRNNTLDVPESVADLFPETAFDDNGYGYVVEVGLNGGDPRRSFQQWGEARVVTKWQHALKRQAQNIPRPYPQGMSLQELGEHSFQ